MKAGDIVTCLIDHKWPCLMDESDEYPNGVAEVGYVIYPDSVYLIGSFGSVGTRPMSELKVI